uniref:Uncharacterized protein n=1 Tax=Solanum tuberosum TaxID=4113 RepID=M1C4C9_SOLTU
MGHQRMGLTPSRWTHAPWEGFVGQDPNIGPTGHHPRRISMPRGPTHGPWAWSRELGVAIVAILDMLTKGEDSLVYENYVKDETMRWVKYAMLGCTPRS